MLHLLLNLFQSIHSKLPSSQSNVRAFPTSSQVQKAVPENVCIVWDTRNFALHCKSHPACPEPQNLPIWPQTKDGANLHSVFAPTSSKVRGCALALQGDGSGCPTRGNKLRYAASLYLQLFCLKILTGVISYIPQSFPQAVYLTLKWSYIFNCWQSSIIRHKPAANALCGSAESSMSLPHLADRQR